MPRVRHQVESVNLRLDRELLLLHIHLGEDRRGREQGEAADQRRCEENLLELEHCRSLFSSVVRNAFVAGFSSFAIEQYSRSFIAGLLRLRTHAWHTLLLGKQS